MTLSLADPNRPGARPAPSLLALLSDLERAAGLLDLARAAGFRVTVGACDARRQDHSGAWTAILIDQPADGAELAGRAAALRTTYGDDFALLLVGNGPELPDAIDDLAPPDAPDEARRAFQRAERIAGERKAARLANVVARATMAALDKLPIYVTLLDAKGQRIWTSPAAGRDVGFDARTLDGESSFESRHRTRDTQTELSRLFAESLAHPGTIVAGCSETMRADGKLRRYETRMVNLLDHPEANAIVVMTIEREDALKATPARAEAGPVSFQTLVEDGPLITFVNSVSPKERIVYASPQTARMLGLPAHEVTVSEFDWQGRIHPDDRERVARESALADAGLDEVTIEYRYRIGDMATYRWLRSNARRARDVDGQPVWIGVLSDIEDDRRSRAIAIRHTDEVRLLRSVRQLIAQEHELNDLYALTVIALGQTFAYPAVRIYSLDDDLPVLRAASGWLTDDAFHPDHAQLLSRAIHSGTAMMAGHETDGGDSRVAPGAPDGWMTAEIAVPLVARERVAGLLVLGGTRAQPLEREDLTLAETVAEYLAMAIVRARLHEDVERIGRSYRAVVERMREVIVHLRLDDLAIAFLNPAWTQRLGHDARRFLGRSLLDVVYPDDRAALERALRALADGETSVLKLETRLVAASGELVWMELRARADLRTGDEAEITGMLVDITDRRAYEESLRRSNDLFRTLAFHDPLTGLPNRIVFHDRLEHALAVADRRGAGVAVLFLDLDGFKPVNDRYGHAAGDRALQIVAERFAGVMRSGDTIARLGGDEFGIVLEDLDGDTEARRLAAALVDLMAAPIELDGAAVTVGVSVGIAYIAGRTLTVAEAMAEADAALYQAKRAGGGFAVG